MSPLHLIVYAVQAFAAGYCLFFGGYAFLGTVSMFSLGVETKTWRALGMMLLMLCGSAVLLAAAFFLGWALSSRVL